jgi:DNA invertase Pin-like site-specific DNA recombinase
MRVPAAQYLRMSTEHQQYSLVNQAAKIQEYADEHNFHVVKTYTDSGRSGVLLKNRIALSSLLSDVLSHRSDFKVVLVYDVNRWGRFQDADEAAYYEFLLQKRSRLERDREALLSMSPFLEAYLEGDVRRS